MRQFWLCSSLHQKPPNWLLVVAQMLNQRYYYYTNVHLRQLSAFQYSISTQSRDRVNIRIYGAEKEGIYLPWSWYALGECRCINLIRQRFTYIQQVDNAWSGFMTFWLWNDPHVWLESAQNINWQWLLMKFGTWFVHHEKSRSEVPVLTRQICISDFSHAVSLHETQKPPRTIIFFGIHLEPQK